MHSTSHTLNQPLPTVVESLTNPTTTLNVPHSHHPPVLQPYNAGRNGIGWVPERAGVECISSSEYEAQARWGGEWRHLSVEPLVLCNVWCTQDDYSRLVFCWVSCFGLA